MILIAAVAENRVIGMDNRLPWERIPGDLPRFKKLTTGHAIVMGSRTYDSFGKRPLKDRLNLIVTRQPDFAIGGDWSNLVGIGDLESQLVRATNYRPDGAFYVIGGGDIFAQTINKANKLEITEVHQKPEGNVYFPEINKCKWNETARQDFQTHSFVTYERR